MDTRGQNGPRDVLSAPLLEGLDMGATSDTCNLVIGIYLGSHNSGPAVTLLEERRESSPRYTLRHLSRLPSRVSHRELASGASEIVRSQASTDLDWKLVLGSPNDLGVALQLPQEELSPVITSVKVGRTHWGAASKVQEVSAWALASTLRSHFENGQLRLAAALLRTRDHVDLLLESLLGTRVQFSPRGSSCDATHVDDFVIAAGLALWWTEREAARREGVRTPRVLSPRLLLAGDLF